VFGQLSGEWGGGRQRVPQFPQPCVVIQGKETLKCRWRSKQHRYLASGDGAMHALRIESREDAHRGPSEQRAEQHHVLTEAMRHRYHHRQPIAWRDPAVANLRPRVEGEVAVREDDSLGVSRRAGGKKNRRGVRIIAMLRSTIARRVFLRHSTSRGATGTETIDEERRVRRDAERFRDRACRDEYSGVRPVERAIGIRGSPRRAQDRRRRATPQDAQKRDRELGRVGKQDRNAVATADPPASEHRGHTA
jgi:hypothetical protein